MSEAIKEELHMAQKEEISSEGVTNVNGTPPHAAHNFHTQPSKKVSDHLANERTFLAWIRTGLSIIAFGFVVERFGLLLREIGLKIADRPIVTGHYSTVVGITLTLLGSVVMIVALASFLRNRHVIDKEEYRPHAGFAIALTTITCITGIILAVYLYLTA